MLKRSVIRVSWRFTLRITTLLESSSEFPRMAIKADAVRYCATLHKEAMNLTDIVSVRVTFVGDRRKPESSPPAVRMRAGVRVCLCGDCLQDPLSRYQSLELDGTGAAADKQIDPALEMIPGRSWERDAGAPSTGIPLMRGLRTRTQCSTSHLSRRDFSAPRQTPSPGQSTEVTKVRRPATRLSLAGLRRSFVTRRHEGEAAQLVLCDHSL
jgi:hypothetical protein